MSQNIRQRELSPGGDIGERDARSGASLLKVTATNFFKTCDKNRSARQKIKRISTANQLHGKVFHISPRHSRARSLNGATENMSMKVELSSSPVRSDWKIQRTKFSWRLISESLRNPDVVAVFVFAVVGLLLAIALTLLLPFPDEIAKIAQFS
jgi:hypothetical protein